MAGSSTAERPLFLFDLNSPYAWLAAERVNSVLPVPPVWQPISFGFLLRETGRTPWSLVDETREPGMRDVEERARERGLLEVRWPEGWPLGTYSLMAMRAAVFAAECGKAAAFALAAFRQQFNAGRGLHEADNVLLAAAACELHPRAVLTAVERDTIKQRLKDATGEAVARGVVGVPTVIVGDELFWGDDRLEDAAEALKER